MNNNFFALRILGVGAMSDGQEVQVNCVEEKSFTLNVKQVSGQQQKTVKVKVSGSLLNVKVNKRIGKHNCITATLKIVEDKGEVASNGSKTLNVFNLRNTFSNVEIHLDVQTQVQEADNKTVCKDLFKVAYGYSVLSVTPRYDKANSTYYVDLGIYSKDILLNTSKYSKVYTAQRLGQNIFVSIMSSHGFAENEYTLSDMRVLKCHTLDDSGNDQAEIELILPYIVQYNETEYNFLLRNANRCGEFLYFENGKLNLGLTRIYDKIKKNNQTVYQERIKSISESDYSSIESVYDYKPENTAQCHHHNAIYNSEGIATPYVAEYANEDCFDSFSDKSNDSKDECQSALFYDTWSRVLSRLFQYRTLVSFGISNLVGEVIMNNAVDALVGGSLMKINGVYFDKKLDDAGMDSQYAIDGSDKHHTQFSDFYTYDDKSSLKSKKGTIPAKYRPDSDMFYAMREAEEAMAREQYRIVFDNKQMEYNLGDIIILKDFGEERYVVVDVQSNYDGNGTGNIVNQMIVTVIPVRNDAPVPLPAETEQIKVVGAQSAVVVDNNDPKRLYRVRVKFSWQNDNATTPWIRVAVPFATCDGSGLYCQFTAGDEVMVDFEYGNIERPFVVGAVYNKTNTPPYGQRKYSTVFRSINGHTIAFNDAFDENSIFSSLFPGLNVLKMIPQVMSGLTKPTTDKSVLRALGGIEISDYYGMYKITTSSDQRKITIESPFGTVDMSAAMGINITAPNGDIKISGKNVDIEAGNNLTLKSGTNIGSSLSSLIPQGNRMAVAQAEVMTALGFVGGLFDVPALRFVIDLLIKPINGTLTVHSGRYLMLEAGAGKANVPQGSFKNCQGKLDLDPLKEVTVNGEKMTSAKATGMLIRKIASWRSNLKNYKEFVEREHKVMVSIYTELKSYLISVCEESFHSEINKTIDNWVKNESFNKKAVEDDLGTKDPTKMKLKSTLCRIDRDRKLINDVPKTVSEIFNKAEELNKKYVAFKNIETFGKEIFTIGNAQGQTSIDENAFNAAKKMRAETDSVSSLMTATNLFKTGDGETLVVLRKYIFDLIKEGINDKYLVYDNGAKLPEMNTNDYNTEQKWSEVTNKISTATKSTWALAAWNVGVKKTVNGIIPLDTFSSLTWKPEAKGTIIMSQKPGISVTLDGTKFDPDDKSFPTLLHNHDRL